MEVIHSIIILVMFFSSIILPFEFASKSYENKKEDINDIKEDTKGTHFMKG